MAAPSDDPLFRRLTIERLARRSRELNPTEREREVQRIQEGLRTSAAPSHT